MFILYDVIFLVFALVYVPCLVCKQKIHAGFRVRFGSFPQELVARLRDRDAPVIWVHAVSVGEVAVVAGLIERIRARFPAHQVALSTVTRTGYALAQSRLGTACVVLYAPLDFSFIVKKFIAVIRPVMYITAETELWPNLFSCLQKNKVPIAVVNGRISDTSLGGYRAVRFLLSRILRDVAAFCMQTVRDSERIVSVGAPEKVVHTVGNMKFDALPGGAALQPPAVGFDQGEPVFVAGSTHPGEEKIVLDAFVALRKEHPALRLIIAPRHVERTDEVTALVAQQGLRAVKFSEINNQQQGRDTVVVVDTIGHLPLLYGIATIVFVGKSLTVNGGHNIIEPASAGKPVVVGPKMRNFRDVADIFLRDKAIVMVRDRHALLPCLQDLMSSPERLRELGNRAHETVEKQKGATNRTMDIIAPLIRDR